MGSVEAGRRNAGPVIIDREWFGNSEFRKEWRAYMSANARARGYPEWIGADNAWTPTAFYSRFGNAADPSVVDNRVIE